MSSAIPNLPGYDDMIEYYQYYNSCGNVSENFDLSLPLIWKDNIGVSPYN